MCAKLKMIVMVLTPTENHFKWCAWSHNVKVNRGGAQCAPIQSTQHIKIYLKFFFYNAMCVECDVIIDQSKYSSRSVFQNVLICSANETEKKYRANKMPYEVARRKHNCEAVGEEKRSRKDIMQKAIHLYFFPSNFAIISFSTLVHRLKTFCIASLFFILKNNAFNWYRWITCSS